MVYVFRGLGQMLVQSMLSQADRCLKEVTLDG